MEQILPPDSEAAATPDEIAALTAAGLAPDRGPRDLPADYQFLAHPEWFNDYGGSALLQALRAGYALATAAAQPVSEPAPEAPTPTAEDVTARDVTAEDVTTGIPGFSETGLHHYPAVNLHLVSAHAHADALTLTEDDARDEHEREHRGAHDPASLAWVEHAVLDTLAEAAASGQASLDDLLPHLRGTTD